MTYEEKLDLILKAIVEARKATVHGWSTKIYINEGNGLNHIGKEEVRDILEQLERDVKIIRLNDIINRLLPVNQQLKNLQFLQINILSGFDTWYTNYLIKQKGSIENLSPRNFNEVYNVLALIEDQLQFSQSESFNLSFISSGREISGYEAQDIEELKDGFYTEPLISDSLLRSEIYGKFTQTSCPCF